MQENNSMKGYPAFLLLFYSLLLFLGESADIIHAGNGSNDNEVYIVYMGAADSANASLRNDHAQVLNLVLRR